MTSVCISGTYFRVYRTLLSLYERCLSMTLQYFFWYRYSTKTFAICIVLQHSYCNIFLRKGLLVVT